MERISVKDYNPDIKAHWDRVFVGPFGEILRLLELFNDRYKTNIGITPKLAWKRGAYDQVKEAVAIIVDQVNKRPKGMHSIFDNRRATSYIGRNLEKSIVEIQNKMYNLKAQGVRMTPDVAIKAFSDAKERMLINNDVSMIDKDIDIETYIERDDEDLRQDVFGIKVLIKNITLKIKSMDEDTEEYVIDQEFECGNVIYNTYCRVFDYINKYPNWIIDAVYIPNNKVLIHPFISNTIDNVYHNNYRNYCLGDLDYNIREASKNLDIHALALHLRSWVSEFITNKTVPLNAPKMMYIGHPSYLNERYVRMHPKDVTHCEMIMVRHMFYGNEPENMPYTTGSRSNSYNSHRNGYMWGECASRIRTIISGKNYFESIEDYYKYANGHVGFPAGPLNSIFADVGVRDSSYNYYVNKEDLSKTLNNVASYGALECDEIECTLKSKCSFNYQMRAFSDQLTIEEVDIESKLRHDAGVLYIRWRTVKDFANEMYELQDYDPDVYDDIPELLRVAFHDKISQLNKEVRHFRVNYEARHILMLLRRSIIPQLVKGSANLADIFAAKVEDVEDVMNRIREYMKSGEVKSKPKVPMDKIKRHIPDWDTLDEEVREKALATLINSNII